MTGASDPISRALDEVRESLAGDARGALPTYIPELATVDPDRFGISLASLDGRIFEAGDVDLPFTIQSVSKPFVYALALVDHGLEGVLARVGAEPSGEAFNAISLEAGTGRPANPMINAGAIVTTSLVEAPDPAARFARIREMLSAFAGRELEVDEAVYRSEWETGDMNRALGYLMRNAGSLTADVDETLDAYFRQCAVLVTSRDLAVMAATLANGGVNPVTGQEVVPDQVASHVLTVMGTCGMYDGSGEWLLRVGLPAKSGVSGALLAAKPAQFGIGLYSPRLDAKGNSVRATETLQRLASRFGLHLLNHPGPAGTVFWLEGTGVDHHSSKARSEEERARLAAHGDAIAIRGLQGEIGFAAAERVLTACGGPDRARRWLALDVSRVTRAHPAAKELLEAMATDLGASGIVVVIVDPHQRGLLDGIREFRTMDAALESIEDHLLREDA